jgi:hypothetical protein
VEIERRELSVETDTRVEIYNKDCFVSGIMPCHTIPYHITPKPPEQSNKEQSKRYQNPSFNNASTPLKERISTV